MARGVVVNAVVEAGAQALVQPLGNEVQALAPCVP
jgi:hypothetical protein